MSESRILLVQCCHLPQFFFVAEKLRQRHPEWQLDALFCASAQVDFYLGKFPCFQRIHFLENPVQSMPDCSDVEAMVFPLLNRGYWKIKRMAWSLGLKNLEVDYRGELQPLSTRSVYVSLGKVRHPPGESFVAYSRQFPLPPLGKRILLVESCRGTLLKEVQESLDRLIPADAQIHRIQKDPMGEIRRYWRQHRFEGAVVFLSGEPGFGLMKLLPFVLSIPRVVGVTETGQFFEADARRLCRFLLGRIRQGVSASQLSPRILLIQTETAPHVEYVIEQLKKEKFYPRSEIVLLCRQEDRVHFESNPHLDRVLTYSRTGIRDQLQLWKRLRKLGPDISCAIFSGRPYFRLPKLLFCSLPTRRRIVFNARLNCYDLKARTFFRIFKREPLLLEPETSMVSLKTAPRVLLLQTEHSLETIKAIEVLASDKVAPGARVSVFCSARVQGVFESLPQVEKTLVYHPGKPVESLGTLWQAAWSGSDVVAVILSGRPIFWKQKFLFFLLPVRYRLVFNEHLECFYLGWRNAHLLLHRRSNASVVAMGGLVLRKVAKLFLFLPRFAFLLVWVAIMKLKGGHSLD